VAGNKLAKSLVSRALSIVDAEIREGWLAATLRETPIAPLAEGLDALCHDAEQAVPEAREVMVSLVQVINAEHAGPIAQLLREEAAGRSLVALARFLRRPTGGTVDDRTVEERVPDYGTGRPLTLGERKALARRPNRGSFDALLRDPHPDVIHNLLANPKLTEDDVVRLAARRPPRPEILAQIARTSRWATRARVRMAIVLNPGSPAEIAVPLVALLVRHELRLVVQVTEANPAVRAAARESLVRRPPSLGGNKKDDGAG
jgi:hypothetical protein